MKPTINPRMREEYSYKYIYIYTYIYYVDCTYRNACVYNILHCLLHFTCGSCASSAEGSCNLQPTSGCLRKSKKNATCPLRAFLVANAVEKQGRTCCWIGQPLVGTDASNCSPGTQEQGSSRRFLRSMRGNWLFARFKERKSGS